MHILFIIINNLWQLHQDMSQTCIIQNGESWYNNSEWWLCFSLMNEEKEKEKKKEKKHTWLADI